MVSLGFVYLDYKGLEFLPCLSPSQLAGAFLLCTQVMREYSSLQTFWKRYNKVLLDKLSLDREKQILEEENSKLKILLKQYLDGKVVACGEVFI